MESDDDHLECAICLKIFTKPKFLPCFHTCCLGCLDQMIESTNLLTCPQCRQVHKIPPGGVSELTTNFFVDGKSEQKRRQGSSCDNCMKKGAIWFCTNCDQNLCDSCKTTHDSLTACKDHCVHSLNEEISLESVNQHRYCTKHPKDKVEFYCMDCSKPICMKCKMLFHGNHTAEDIDDAIEKAKVVFGNLQDKLLSAQNNLKQEMAKCEESKIERRERSEVQLQMIDQKAMEIIQTVQLMQSRLKGSVTDNLETELAPLTKVMKELHGSHTDTLVVAEKLEKIDTLHEVDMMKAVPLLTEDINAIYNTRIPYRYYKNMDLNTTEATPPAVDDLLGKLNGTQIGKFQERFNADLKLGTLHRSRVCEIGNHSFRLDVKRWKDDRNRPHPVEQFGVYCSIGDGDSTPVDALIRVQLLRNGSGHDDAMTEEGEFTFNIPGSGHGWNRFMIWDQVIDPEERFVSCEELIFNVLIAVKEI
ncbi:E3 ubiquitin-protein ligase TRIM56 [Patella vulgata]|uniref:E3 ubiquitin-protein ligase TRIM56 n=1 Tax=Patella vulgata TaxID=6465 RepID=UPI0021809963|nr:E3 ubiquitin-protein ligase TRIM56 [Patella vulgata]XP_050419100.1 E3 ubiquitin-protein ligase TRIM56 [Patella vulgata]